MKQKLKNVAVSIGKVGQLAILLFLAGAGANCAWFFVKSGWKFVEYLFK